MVTRRPTGTIFRLRGTGTPEDALPGEAAWRWRMQLRIERLISPLRVLVVLLSGADWLLRRPAGAPVGAAALLLAAAGVYAAADLVVVYRFSDFAERCPWGATVLDLLFVLSWVGLTGGRHSPYLTVLFLVVGAAPLRLRPVAALAVVAVCTALYAHWQGGHLMGALYLGLLGLLQTAWVNRLYRDRRSDLRDALTGALGRGYALFRIELLLRQRSLPFALALVDLDGFKTVNDTHGHGAGDEVLREVVALIAAALRDHDLVARYGGDELLLLWPGLTAAQAAVAAERIRDALASTALRLREAGVTVAVTSSIGVAQAWPGCTAAQLLQVADRALYRAKQHGAHVAVAAGLDG